MEIVLGGALVMVLLYKVGLEGFQDCQYHQQSSD